MNTKMSIKIEIFLDYSCKHHAYFKLSQPLKNKQLGRNL